MRDHPNLHSIYPEAIARRLERALCALADLEGPVKQALADACINDGAYRDVCAAIRRIIDGD